MLTYNAKDFGALGNGASNDTLAIQAALDAAHDAGGGRVYIPAGTYILTGDGDASHGALRVYSNTELYGDGMGKTELKLQDGYSEKITGMIRTPVNEVTEDVIIRDLTINGNRANATAEVDGLMTGVLPGSPLQDTNILIERVEIHDVSRIAFNPHEQTTNLIIRDSVAHHNSWDGFVGDFVSNAVYQNNVAYANDRHGFNIVTHSHDVAVIGNKAYDNAEFGIIVQRGAGSKTIDGWAEMLNHTVLVENNTVYGNDRGIVLKQTENSQFIGNNIYGNDREGIYLEGARNNVFDGNTVNGSSDAIEIVNYSGSLGGPADSYGNVVINNILHSTSGAALVEGGSTTTGNTYAGNVVDAAIKLGSGAIVLASSDGITYKHITVTAALPDIATVTPTPEPTPVVVENLTLAGTDVKDTLTGGDGNDTIKGRAGDDILSGGKGNDYMEGNDGNDTLYGGLGVDKLKGGNGVDTFVYHTLAEGGDTITDFRAAYSEKIDLYDVLDNSPGFEKTKAFSDGYIRLLQNGADVSLYVDLDGTAGAGSETLFLTLLGAQTSQFTLNNFVLPDYVALPTPTPTPTPTSTSPTDGNDVIVGGSSNDKLKGYGGDDLLYGNAGNDYIEGNAGNDRIVGGRGADTLKGGDGADTFVLEDILEGGDTILDFRSTDRIDLSVLVDDFSGTSSSSVSQLLDSGHLSIVDKGSNVTALYADLDGHAGAGAAVLLVNITTETGKAFDPTSILI